MVHHSQRFMELSEKLDGLKPDALQTFFYWNNPFALKDWTMNVVELLLIGAATLAFLYGLEFLTVQNDPSILCIWVASVVYILAIEVPIYFPERFGGNPNSVIFIHNEFSTGVLYNRTPLYILALYPAILVPAYVLVKQAGIFEGPWGLLQGAICAAFIHHIFYQIFDHLGPQLKWWLWDYEKSPGGNIALRSVPFYTLFSFSFVGPFAFYLLSHGIFAEYVENGVGIPSHTWNILALIGLTFAVGFLTTPLSRFIGGVITFAASLGGPNIGRIKASNYAVLAGAGVLTFIAFQTASFDSPNTMESSFFIDTYALIFGVIYLATFAWLWAASLKEYRSAANGVTERGTPIGSFPYVVGCFAACGYILAVSIFSG